MSPVQIRQSFNRAIGEYRDSWHRGPTKKKTAALKVAKVLSKHPWLHDQIPYDILGLVQKDSLP